MMHTPTITYAYFECIPGSGQIKFKVAAAPIVPSPIKPMRISVTPSFHLSFSIISKLFFLLNIIYQL